MSGRRLVIGLLAAAVVQIACDPDPARSVVIPRPGDTSARIAAVGAGGRSARAPATGLQWNLSLCPPPSESADGPSALLGRGACEFQQRGGASCILTDDDLLMEIVRPMPNDGLFMLYVSVENFVLGGENDNGIIVVGVQTPRGLYRWTTDTAHLTNARDESAVTIPDAHLPSVPPIEAPEVVVSGTFACGSIDRQR